MTQPEQIIAFVADLGSLETLKLHLYVTEHNRRIDDESDSTHEP